MPRAVLRGKIQPGEWVFNDLPDIEFGQVPPSLGKANWGRA